ncbi:Crp/Fnr family transcriptional regulator [Sphingomonas sp. PAMC 26621]|uniref:Crp/Fnr family transcriptional regulator n=1 Tax=Sphingomonas sp. PAMC 26621 TaxID=1112213 RepID=UPI0002891711|nr:Crp/Fnr family transcriptional regulator [Sphingomonas sp. PAMC 26621]
MFSFIEKPAAALGQKLCGSGMISHDEVDALQSLPLRTLRLKAGAWVVTEGQLVSECGVLISGYACRHKVAKDGGRQIVSFHVAGDFLDVQHLWLENADHNVQLITDANVAFVPVTALRQLVEEHPAIGVALWRDSLLDASVFREWVLNVGRRGAKTRIAHMLCEFVTRSEAAGLGSPSEQVIPMTQEHIGDATGLTSVHVNRMLRTLREDGALQGSGRDLQVADWKRLKQIAEFRADYLHLAA